MAIDISQLGRGAFLHGRSLTGRTGGQAGRENAGMSSEKKGENPFHRKPKVPGQRSSSQGKSGPNPRRRRVGDGQQVEIPVLAEAV